MGRWWAGNIELVLAGYCLIRMAEAMIYEREEDGGGRSCGQAQTVRMVAGTGVR
jgi:hypothetical protein